MNKFPLSVALGLVLVTQTPTLAPAQEKKAVYEGKTVGEWVQVLKSGGPAARQKALRALGRIGPEAKAAVPALIATLRNKDALYFEHTGALSALGRIGLPAVPPLIEIVKDKKAKTVDRMVASEALGRVGPDAIPALVKLLKDEDKWTRYWGAVAIRYVGPQGKGAVEALSAVLADKDDYVRMMAARALGNIGPKAKDAIPPLTKMARDDEAMGFEACAALAGIGPDAVPALIVTIKDTKSESNRWEAIQSLRKIGAEAKAAVPLLLDLAKTGKGLTRAYARVAVLRIDPKAAAKAGIKE
jgi:HEAT repeat protein